LDSLGEDGVVGEGVVAELSVPPVELEELDEDAPVLGLVVVSAPVEGGVDGVGVGAVVVLGGGVVVVVFSSFLQAVKASATIAAIRSERVIEFSFEQVL
jgi:hypothetical protein